MAELIDTGKMPQKEIYEIFCETMEQLIQADNRVVYLDADLMGSLKTKSLWEKYPKNVFNTGIQEANMVGVACGMYLAGCKPYIHSFAPFISRRVFDQVFISGAYAKKSLKLIGSDAGIAATYNGGTHMCFEDLALYRTIPGACIVDVSDGKMFAYFLTSLKDYEGIVYFRTARRGVKDIYKDTETFEPGKGKLLAEGHDATIVASGLQVEQAIEAARLLEKEQISVKVIDIVTVKPLDQELLITAAKETGLVVVTENHNICGGLGDAVSAVLAENYPVRVLKNGIPDRFGQVGNVDYLRKQYGMRSIDLAELVKQGLYEKRIVKQAMPKQEERDHGTFT